MRIESTIISNLISNEEFTRKVAPHIVPAFFSDKIERTVVSEILDFFGKFNKIPTKEIVKIELNNNKTINDKELLQCAELVEGLSEESSHEDWLIDRTEKFCRDRAVFNAIMESIKVFDGTNKELSQDAIPKLLQDALAVSFDESVCHDYIDNANDRFEFYHRVEEKLPFNLDMMNKITKGGLNKKTLNVILAGPKVGKSLFMCHVAAAALLQGKNVLYISLELAEERIAERIDANLMNISMDELAVIDKEFFDKKINRITSKTHGRLKIKEFPTSSAHTGHFRALLEQLKVKQNFIADLIVIDYLNICASARMKMSSNGGTYSYVKSIAEEIRGLAVEYNVPILSATQVNREGFSSSDIEMTNTSESFGVPAVVDLFFAIIRSEELDALNQIMVKQLASRYSDPTINKRFVLGVDRAKMQLYDVESYAQHNIADSNQVVEDSPVFDNSSFGKRSRKKFDNFNY